MGLDQYLVDRTVTSKNFFEDPVEDVAYWRKHWSLQKFLGTENCETLQLTEELCDKVINNIDVIYPNYLTGENRTETINNFKNAKKLIQAGRCICYEADW